MKKWICLLLAVALMGLAGCGMDTQKAYEAAQELYQAGNYAEAAKAFEALGGYVDSALMVMDCRYAMAEELYDAGDYAGAAEAFSLLEGYSDSVARVTACQYAIAEELYARGDIVAAEAAFTALGDYQDSPERVIACRYDLARQLYDAGDYLAAAEALEALGSYADAKQLCEDARWQALLVFLIGQPACTTEDGYNVGITAIEPDQLTLWVERITDLGFYVSVDRCAIAFRIGETEARYELQTQTQTQADGLTGRSSCSVDGTVLLAELTADTQLPLTNFTYHGQDVYGNVTQRTEPWVGEREHLTQLRGMLGLLLEQTNTLLEQSGSGYTLRDLGLSAVE